MNNNPLFAAVFAGIILPVLSLRATDVGAAAKPLFSENFESGTLNPDVWTQEVTGTNIVTVQSYKVAHGKFALKVSCPTPSSRTWAFISASHLPEALKQHQYGRAYMMVTPLVPMRHTVLIMSGTSGFPKNKYEEVATAHGRWQITYVDRTHAPGEEDYHSAGAIPLNRWFCLEWEFNDHPNHAAVWVDGKLIFESSFVSKSTHATTDLVGGFSDIAFGFRLWGAAPDAFDVYYDDIVIDTKPVGAIVEKAP
jgi:hypothetical protein